jgi:hypothetical protein
MGIVPWDALLLGNYKTGAQRQSSGGRGMSDIPEANVMVSKILESMAKDKATITTSTYR